VSVSFHSSTLVPPVSPLSLLVSGILLLHPFLAPGKTPASFSTLWLLGFTTSPSVLPCCVCGISSQKGLEARIPWLPSDCALSERVGAPVLTLCHPQVALSTRRGYKGLTLHGARVSRV
ncbi:hypothetical protein CSUI_008690, partial [Cystoisospora suis]